MLRIRSSEGIAFEFKNGLTVTAQIGARNYCSNYCKFDKVAFETECDNCELAVIHENIWVTRYIMEKLGFETDPDEDVVGYVSADALASVLAFASAMSEEEVTKMVADFTA